MSSPQDPQDPFRAPSDDERGGGSRPPQGGSGGSGHGWGSGPQDPARSSWESSQGSPQQGGWGAPGDGHGQQSYGAPAPYGAPGQGYPGQGFGPPPDHPRATTSMVLGIGGLVGAFLCLLPIVLSPFAMVMGRRVVKEIDASQGRQGGRGQAQAGFVLGIIGTVLLALGVVGVVLFFLLFAVAIPG